MHFAIIADDLTGASDTGVQLAKTGFQVSVWLDEKKRSVNEFEAVVFDTDSRAVPAREAYDRVSRVCMRIREHDPQVVYKKIDSTLRGNIGAELDAVYDHFQPDFVVIAPAFPQTGRTVERGVLYVNGVPVNETDAGRDTQAPVQTAYVPHRIGEQSERQVGLITSTDLTEEREQWQHMLRRFKEDGTVYLVLDTVSRDDLRIAAAHLWTSGYRFVWAGSAGLADALANLAADGGKKEPPTKGKTSSIARDVLFVVGSTNTRSRQQLQQLLANNGVQGIELNVQLLLQSGERELHLERIVQEAERSFGHGQTVVLYTSDRSDAVLRAGVGQAEWSREIAAALGEAASAIAHRAFVTGLVLTGGDTAKQVILQLGCTELELLDELETGVPIGRIRPDYAHDEAVYTVTKAGGFGSDKIFVMALEMLGGGFEG